MKRIGTNTVAHSWVCERNNKRDSLTEDYQEVELSELLSVQGYGLIGVYIHDGACEQTNGKGNLSFLQADAICVYGDIPQYFTISIPSRFDGGHGWDSQSEVLPSTVWDDIVLRFDKKQNRCPLTWIAAVHNEEVIELYGTPINYSDARQIVPPFTDKEQPPHVNPSEGNDHPCWKALVGYFG